MSSSAPAAIHPRGTGFDILFSRDRRIDGTDRVLPQLPSHIADKIFAMAGGTRYSEGAYQQWAIESYNALFGHEIQ